MTAAKLKERPAHAPINARELMEQLNVDAGKLNIWVRTELNAPAQRAWFTDTGGKTGAGQLAAGGRVAANQIKPSRPPGAGRIIGLFSIASMTLPAGLTFADRIRRPTEHSSDQSWPRRTPTGDQHHALRDFHLYARRCRTGAYP